MPHMDGLALVEKVLKERPNMRVLIMSGHVSEEIRGQQAGFTFLRKPFLPAVFRQKVREVLEGKPGERTY
jgi:DNA-binding response OmpR family regulator